MGREKSKQGFENDALGISVDKTTKAGRINFGRKERKKKGMAGSSSQPWQPWAPEVNSILAILRFRVDFGKRDWHARGS